MTPVCLSVHAMATRFELVLYGEDSVHLRAAGEEALQEIERLESQLSFYSPSSEISRINALAAEQPVKVEARLFNLLRDCIELTRRTEGAFDITIGPLMRAWRFFGSDGLVPDAGEIDSIRSLIGIGNIELEHKSLTVRFKRRGVQLDLGAYGKGYAIDRAIGLLSDNGITIALLHGGGSSIHCLGARPGASAWEVGLSQPFNSGPKRSVVNLRDSALSISALHGKSILEHGVRHGHVLDPRTCAPVKTHAAAAVTGADSALCEALSTALLVNGPKWLSTMTECFPGFEGIVALENGVCSSASWNSHSDLTSD
jgi:FAD:protein FMN transferase